MIKCSELGAKTFQFMKSDLFIYPLDLTVLSLFFLYIYHYLFMHLSFNLPNIFFHIFFMLFITIIHFLRNNLQKFQQIAFQLKKKTDRLATCAFRKKKFFCFVKIFFNFIPTKCEMNRIRCNEQTQKKKCTLQSIIQ